MLKNKSNKPITIDRDRTNCACAQTRVWGEKLFTDFPYTVAPDAEVRIIMAVEFVAIRPGPAAVKVELLGEDQQAVAILILKGRIENGITLSTDTMDFGSIAAGAGSTQEFTLSLNGKIAYSLPPGAPLQFTSSSPHVKISNIPSPQPIPGLKLGADTIEIIHEKRDDLPTKIVLKYKAELLKTAPLGVSGSRLRLVVSGFPLYTLVDSVRMQAKWEVVGHMKLVPSDVVVLGTHTQGKGTKGSVNVNVSAPLTLNDLRLTCANPNLAVRFIPAASKGADATNSTTVEIILSPDTPVGRISEKVAVTNVKNDERLEIRVYASVIK